VSCARELILFTVVFSQVSDLHQYIKLVITEYITNGYQWRAINVVNNTYLTGRTFSARLIQE